MPIPLFQLLANVEPALQPSATKIHLACWNGKEHPLDVYLASGFEEWQSWQNQRNFGLVHRFGHFLPKASLWTGR